MKKIFTVLAIVATVFAVSCKKEDPKKDDPGKKDDPQKEEPAKYEAPIIIDGNFDDWAKIDESKLVISKVPGDAAKTDLKLAKIYYDEYYMFIYAEYDFTAYDNAPETAVFNVMLNGDNSTATGGYMGDWDQGDTPCVDLMCQGDVVVAGEVVDYDPGMYKFAGEPNTSEWLWDEVTVSGFITGKGTKKAIEIQITRELYPLGKLADELTMGLQVLVNGWDSTGVVPMGSATDDNPSGQVNLLTVKVVK